MRTVGNVFWFVLGGWYTALAWLIGAAVFALSIIGLPLTRAAIEIAKMSAFPFGKEIVHVRDLDGKGLTTGTAITGTIGFIANVAWLLTFGWALFLLHALAGVLCCLTIIGIPFGLQSFKLAAIALWPVGRRVVTREVAKRIRQDQAAKFVESYRARA
jgi:uncharacterized membrane protein YccF (DUF307 family)